MLRAALIFSFAPVLLAGCSALPEAAARETAISAASPWPALLTTDELARALPDASDAQPGPAVNTTEAELNARAARLKSRADALRSRSAG